jgi:hypothetical protein
MDSVDWIGKVDVNLMADRCIEPKWENFGYESNNKELF